MTRFAVSVFAVLVFATVLPAPAAAQETYFTCVGFIDSIPATITTQGVWCLRRDLGTNMTSGSAITIAAPNVTIACNQFKLGGQAAGPGTEAYGIRNTGHANTTIRGCNIRGFQTGVDLVGSGHIVEDSRFDSNTRRGVVVFAPSGGAFTIRRNILLATGDWAIAVRGAGDVLDNSITGVGIAGIWTDSSLAPGIAINGNRVRGLVPPGGGGLVYGIRNLGRGRVTMRDNDVMGPGTGSPGWGLSCYDLQGTARDNTISGFEVGIVDCRDATGNVIAP